MAAAECGGFGIRDDEGVSDDLKGSFRQSLTYRAPFEATRKREQAAMAEADDLAIAHLSDIAVIVRTGSVKDRERACCRLRDNYLLTHKHLAAAYRDLGGFHRKSGGGSS